MVHKRRFVVFFFFFRRQKVLPPRRLRKESAPPCRIYIRIFSRAFFYPQLSFFLFWRRRGPARGGLCHFCFVFFYTEERRRDIFGPRRKKKARRNKRAKTKNQSSSRAVREKSQRSHSLKSLFCRFRDDDNDLLDIFFLPFSIDEEVVREEHHRRRRFEEERR